MVVIGSKPHALCLPFPAQGHVNPFLHLAKLLHHRAGFRITFVNTEFNHRRRLKSGGPHALDGLPDFQFKTIPDGLPPSDAEATQDIPSLWVSITKNCLEPLCDILSELNFAEDVPPVSVIIADGVMAFATKAAERFSLPVVLFWTPSACGFLGYTQYSNLKEKGYTPLKDPNQLTNGYLEAVVDWIPGMKGIRLKDLPTFLRTTDPEDIVFNSAIQEVNTLPKAKALLLNTYDSLESDALTALSAMSIMPPIYTIGPLHLMLADHVEDERFDSISLSLWKQELNCIQWLDTKPLGSVVYVNFGSIAVMSAQQMTEFAWGLANSKKDFLWIIRPDLVSGEKAILPPEFVTETRDRSMLLSWCPQDKVLKHEATGLFLVHCGWNSTLESISGGVPVICWPFFAEQQTNCRYCCVEWEMGMEIDNDVKRDEVEALVREVMDGEKGKKMRKKAMEWKGKAEKATGEDGSSYMSFDKLVTEVLLRW